MKHILKGVYGGILSGLLGLIIGGMLLGNLYWIVGLLFLASGFFIFLGCPRTRKNI